MAIKLVVVSQIWIQHLNCLQIIGHCYLRVGSELEPELGGSLYSALVIVLADIEESYAYQMSGIYGYRIPEIEGFGLFTIQNEYFRIFFLCEGLYGQGIPYLSGNQIEYSVKKLFNELNRIIPEKTCENIHQAEEGSFWFDFMFSMGFGSNIIIKEIKRIYPLRYIQIKVNCSYQNEVNVERLESAEIGTLGYGWQDKLKMVSSKIDGIFCKPQASFLVYEALFKQIKEFIPDFEPNTIILAYQKSIIFEPENAIVAFLSLESDTLTIRYAIPVPKGISIDGDRATHSYLKSIFLDSF